SFSDSAPPGTPQEPIPQLPRSTDRARWRVLHARRVERRAPAAVVVLRQLQVEPLAVHPDGDVPDAGPGVEPRTQRRAPGRTGGNHAEKPTAERRSWPRWSSTAIRSSGPRATTGVASQGARPSSV